jgi:DNA invertase Pin-like site-specific DNA recombinase
MKIGYARVSTQDQNLQIQLETLEKAGCERIYKEKKSGATRARPELVRALENLRKGDVVIVWKLDRLARSTRDLLDITDKIKAAGAQFKSISEPWADTTSPAGKMVMTVFAGIAEFERELIHERTSAGRVSAKKRGVKFGRPHRLSSEQRKLALRLLGEDNSVRQVADTFGVHVATIYRLQETH